MLNNRKFILIIVVLLILGKVVQSQEPNLFYAKFDSQLVDIAWCGSDHQKFDTEQIVQLTDYNDRETNRVFVQDIKGQIFYSNDHGVTWINLQQFMANRSQDITGVNIQDIKISRKDPTTVFLFGEQGTSFVLKDCGSEIRTFRHDPELNNFRLNRFHTDYILAMKDMPCDEEYQNDCDLDKKDILVSYDQGQSWRKILSNAIDAQWDHSLFQNQSYKRIVATIVENNSQILYYSDNDFQTKIQIDTDIESFFQDQHYLFAVKALKQEEHYQLKIASLDGDHLTQPLQLSKAVIPGSNIKQHSFQILRSENDIIYLSVKFKRHDIDRSMLYISDVSGINYVKSLANLVTDESSAVDFMSADSAEGVHIANIYDPQAYKFELGDAKNQKSDLKLIKTKISYNNGGVWRDIQYPKYDYSGNEIKCEQQQCSLNLHSVVNKSFQGILAPAMAPGMMIGIGNVGVYLDNDGQYSKTYLSNDGGLNWQEIYDKATVYAIGDRGSVIVIAPSFQKTDSVLYSWDSGKTWKKQIISQQPIKIRAIMNENSSTSLKFLIFSTRQLDQDRKPFQLIFTLDLSTIHQRECQGHDNVNSVNSDYEIWTPHYFNPSGCVLGQKISYIRKIPGKQCYNPIKISQEHKTEETCACTEQDWECDRGYEMDLATNTCVPNKSVQQYLNQLQSYNCLGSYYMPSGYRKIPGDKCIGGVMKQGQYFPCPQEQQNSQNQMQQNGNSNQNQNQKISDPQGQNLNPQQASQNVYSESSYNYQNTNQQTTYSSSSSNSNYNQQNNEIPSLNDLKNKNQQTVSQQSTNQQQQQQQQQNVYNQQDIINKNYQQKQVYTADELGANKPQVQSYNQAYSESDNQNQNTQQSQSQQYVQNSDNYQNQENTQQEQTQKNNTSLWTYIIIIIILIFLYIRRKQTFALIGNLYEKISNLKLSQVQKQQKKGYGSISSSENQTLNSQNKDKNTSYLDSEDEEQL
ncbi:hypothetical protein PPERSA_07744 [Pseudocohnilembus persalinus]|uniref:VPS10 domain-containing protein n=1 Tax=Pseudocohnilembus persalinus TaxID=266149 RepID=A0A0V0R9T2_PSEPJ|nr:hypothetical protein PPERSA_07744 [Pseudocohnilembus persalinus]|eukprot:KRX11219.1 hypothetical protein PPERSA_07744 [Pseudocohnilembus persalinus]